MYIVPEKDLVIIITCEADENESDIYIPVMMVFEAVVQMKIQVNK